MRPLLCVLVFAAAATAQQPRPKLTDVPVKTDEVVFKTTPQGDLKLHLYYPPGWTAEDRRPAVVFFFGGGWVNGSHLQFKPQAEYLAARGMVVACADYRVANQHKTTPDRCVEDAKSAMRYVRGHAAKLGVRPDRIVGAGCSAGGHLAAATYFLDGFNDPADDATVDCRPNALVLFNPAMEVPNRAVKNAAGDDVAAQFWPTAHLKKADVPVVQFFGSADRLWASGKDFAEKAAKLGVPVESWLAADQPHGFFNRPPYTQTTLAKAEAFLVRYGYLTGESTLKVPDDAPVLKRQ
ncbi:MAG: alpha/beta hydrolase [Gemmataceae bacterium]